MRQAVQFLAGKSEAAVGCKTYVEVRLCKTKCNHTIIMGDVHSYVVPCIVWVLPYTFFQLGKQHLWSKDE